MFVARVNPDHDSPGETAYWLAWLPSSGIRQEFGNSSNRVSQKPPSYLLIALNTGNGEHHYVMCLLGVDRFVAVV
ncbi:17574_t:CDS:2, partial [Acaulospora colombiana]